MHEFCGNLEGQGQGVPMIFMTLVDSYGCVVVCDQFR